MDPFEMLPVRFRFGGEIDYDGYSLNYNDGRTQMCHIERDKLSLPELRGYLADHVAITTEDNVEFYWQFPGADMNNGLRKLGSDKDCMYMSQCITEGVVAEVFVEIYKVQRGDIVMSSAGEASLARSPRKDKTSKDVQLLKNIDKPQNSGDEYEGGNSESEAGDTETEDDEEPAAEEDENDSEDSEYLQGDEDTSEDDEEATQFRTTARNHRRNPIATPTVGTVTVNKVQIYESDEGDLNQELPDPPMMDSSDEASYDEDDEGEALRRKSRYPRYDSKAAVPKFLVGMTFRDRKQCKKALIKYGLATWYF